MSADTETKKKESPDGSTIRDVVESVILGMSVIMLAWTANKVVELSNTVASLGSRMSYMESHGTPSLQATVADLREIKAQMFSLSDGQRRIETALQEHMKQRP